MILILVPLLIGLILYWTQRRPPNFPPGPQWYPVFGNSLQLRKCANELGGTHLVYNKWAIEFNSPDVIGLRLGSQLFIVGLSSKALIDIHNKQVFEGRPRNFFTKLRTFDTHGGIMIADGNLWREHRSFAMRRMKGLGFGCAKMQEAIEVELGHFKETIDQQIAERKNFWPGQFLAAHVMNVLWTFIAGEERSIMSKELFRLMDERAKAFDFSGGFLNDNPWLRHIIPEYCGYNLMLKFNVQIQGILQPIIKEHRANYSIDKANDDFIYNFMAEQEKQADKINSTFTDLQLMIVLLDFFFAGSHTTNITFDLCLMSLALYEDIQEELYAELLEALKGTSDLLKISNHKELPLLEAFLMEVGRFYSIVPISGPRRVLENTELCGYSIPKGTTVLIGLEAVHRDKTVWDDPDVFRPSRFLNSSKTEIINSDRVFIYGQGRRSCLGITLAKGFLHTFLVGIVKDYKISVPSDEKPPNQNLIPGIFKTVPTYKVSFTKR